MGVRHEIDIEVKINFRNESQIDLKLDPKELKSVCFCLWLPSVL